MPARLDQKMVGSASKANTSGTVTNGTATATFAAAAATKHYVQKALISCKGTIAAGVRATLTWTYNGALQTVGLQVPIGYTSTGIVALDFGSNPVEGDENTAVTFTLPALGASGDGEVTLIGFSTKT